MLNMGKIRLAVEDVENKLKALPDSEKERLEKSLEISILELCHYQQLKSIAQAEGKIDLETAMFIYNSLKTWSDTKLAYKVVLTQVFALFSGVKL